MELNGKKIRLSVVIVNFRTPEMAIEAASSALHSDFHADMEIVIVDNHSEDDSLEKLNAAFGYDDRVMILDSGKNLGFAGGNNVGLKHVTGDIVLFLNPDTVVSQGALNHLVETMLSDDDIGAVGGMLTDIDGEPVTSFGYFPTPMSMITTSFLPGRFLGKSRKALGVIPSENEVDPYDVDYICGADLMVRRDILDKTGGMDDKYFMYFEETDLCRQIKNAGYRILYDPRSRIAHLEGGSFGDRLVKKRMLFMESSIRFFKKNGYSGFFIWMYHATTLVSSFVKLGYFWLRYVLTPSKREILKRNIAWNGFIFPYYFGIGRKRLET